VAADQVSLEAQLDALQAESGATGEPAATAPRSPPKRQALPEHLRRVEHHHESENTTCD
jgi:transposase